MVLKLGNRAVGVDGRLGVPSPTSAARAKGPKVGP